jgi:hypothetical protein
VNDLEEILNNKINKIFYPKAYFRLDKLEVLEDYWFICLTTIVPIRKYKAHVWKIEIDQDITHMNIEFANLPIEILPFIKILSLFDWQADWLKKINRVTDSIETSAIKFKIPFYVITDDDLLEEPKELPDLSILKKKTITGYDYINDDINVYDVPERNIYLNKEETISFKGFINKIDEVYSSIRIHQNEWKFLELSLDFFIKGFYANGLEQLLWYVTSIEALLGGKEGGLEIKGKNGRLKSEGLTERLGRRISLILGKDKKHQKVIRKSFEELYDFRCNLVHGNVFEKKALIGHLITIRDISRKSILWFIHNLKKVQDEIDGEGTKNIPNREALLYKIDLQLGK